MNRIDKKFQALKKSKKKAFIAFITAGYPNIGITKGLALAFDKIGVDIIELGIPFSDPMADGPIIQEASQFALQKKVHLQEILNAVKAVRRYSDIPICLMTYYNPIFCLGEDKFVRRAKNCGVDGVIVPDLPPEEGRSFIKLANKHNLSVICFISPTTSPKRIRYISGIAKGFIYYVSLTGVTGPRRQLSQGLLGHLRAIKKITKKPVCVGFGLSHPCQVREVYKVCDGVIIGSAIVKKIKDNLSRKDLVKNVARFVEYMKDV